MKTKNRISIPIAIILFFSMIIMNAYAQDRHQAQGKSQNQSEDNLMPPQPPAHGLNPDKQDRPNHPQGEGFEEAPAPLDLPGMTPEQHEKIKKAHLKQVSDMTPLKNQLREKKARLETLLTTMPFDQKQADEVADELGKTGTAILKIQIRHDQELRNLLTPDQQVIFDARPKPWLNKMK